MYFGIDSGLLSSTVGSPCHLVVEPKSPFLRRKFQDGLAECPAAAGELGEVALHRK